MPADPPDLIEAARAVFEQRTTSTAPEHDAETDRRLNALSNALSALPSDAVVVSRALLVEAADVVRQVVGTRGEGAALASQLRTAAGGRA